MLAFVLSTLHSTGQKLLGILPTEGGRVTYTEVVEVETATKDQLYRILRRWFAAAYRDSKNVIEIEDVENGEIFGKGNTKAVWMVTFYAEQPLTVWHSIHCEVREGRYKYTITDFIIEYDLAGDQYGPTKHVRENIESWLQKRPNNLMKIYPQIDADMQSMIAKMKEAVKEPAAEEDW